MERTFVMIKPDGVQRGLVGEVITFFEKKGFKIIALKMMKISRELAEQHYRDHIGKSFFKGLVDYMTSRPVVAMILEGKDAVSTVRNLMGATDPLKAAPGTIRGIYGIDVGRNIIHGSDSLQNAEREITLFFCKNEIISYNREIDKWLYE